MVRNPADLPNLLRFAQYFMNHWMRDDMLPLWNQHNNNGPRTDNHVEGYHNSLSSTFGQTHPVLGEFICDLQKQHHMVSIRARNLLAHNPLHVPRPRHPRFVAIDRQLEAAKNDLLQQLQNNYGNVPLDMIIGHLDRVQQLLGNSNTEVEGVL